VHGDDTDSCPAPAAVRASLTAVIFSLTLLFSGAAAMRSTLARIKAGGAPADPHLCPLRFEAFLDFIGTGEVGELEQRFGEA
jgi:hypothetical protein